MNDSNSTPTRNDLPALGVRRPWLVAVINLLIVIAGIGALLAIEVRELPDVDRPIINVRAQLPGASPETMDSEVTSLLEGAVARVSGVRDISSSSEENSSRIRVEFQPGDDVDRAAADVREAVSRVSRDLPADVEQLAVYKADEDAEEIVRIAVLSNRYSEEALTRIVEQDIVPTFISLPGVADVPLFGTRQRVLRINLDPLRLTSFGLTISDVAEVLRGVPLDVPAGSFRTGDQQLLVRADARAVREAEIENIVLTGNVRIGDVAGVTFGPAEAESFVRLDGQRVIGISVVRQAGSNTIEIAAGVDRAIARVNERFGDIELVKISDNAIFIRGAVKEVLTSLLLAILVVIGTIRVFSGSMRLTLVPAVAIPVSLLGTVACIWMLGFSINILTLLALVLATGLIVDDAIVVLENIQRRQSQGLGDSAAAVLGTRQVFFAVIATTAVLIAVFVPIAFLPGTSGRLFREFGFVLAVSVAISSFVALSLVPAAMAKLGRKDSDRLSAADRQLHRVGGAVHRGYVRSLGAILAHPFLAFAACVLIAGTATSLYTQLDQELLPTEDRGELNIFTRGPEGVGLPYTGRQADRLEEILLPMLEGGDLQSVYTVVGRYDPNIVLISAPLVPWADRSRSQQDVAAEIQPMLDEIPGGARVFSRNSLNLRGASGGLRVALVGNDYSAIFDAAKAYTAAIDERLDSVAGTRISYQTSQPQLSVRIDRRRASELDIPLESIAQTLRAMVGGLNVISLNVDDESVPIMLESGAGSVSAPTDLANLYVRAGNGSLIPLSSMVTLVEEGIASQLDRQSQRRSIRVDVDVKQGVVPQTAVDDLRRLAEEVLPPGIELINQGEAAALDEARRDTLITYGFALLIVFLVLVAQFESLTSALVIMTIVPFGLAAAIFSLFATGTSLNIYSQVGLVMLIGLIAKNGILVVEFADQLRDEGLGILEAVAEASSVRFRPIVMTLVSTVLGALPLVFAFGPGAEARMSVGWVVVGGLGITALFTLYLTPVVYLGLARFTKPRASSAEQLDQELANAVSSA